MAKNRKHQSAAIRFGPALKALGLCLLFAGSAVGFVWQKNQIYQLGQQIRQREIHLKRLLNDDQKAKYAAWQQQRMQQRRGPGGDAPPPPPSAPPSV